MPRPARETLKLISLEPVEDTNNNDTCPICSSIFVEPVKTTCCLQVFCWACISPWLQRSSAHTSCPTCRSRLLLIDMYRKIIVPAAGATVPDPDAPGDDLPPTNTSGDMPSQSASRPPLPKIQIPNNANATLTVPPERQGPRVNKLTRNVQIPASAQIKIDSQRMINDMLTRLMAHASTILDVQALTEDVSVAKEVFHKWARLVIDQEGHTFPAQEFMDVVEDVMDETIASSTNIEWKRGDPLPERLERYFQRIVGGMIPGSDASG